MLKIATLSACLLISSSVLAQKAVYRCETAGKVSYSHEPCLGAKEIDATPTQGMDKMTGQSRKGRDVLRHEQDGVMADALKPLHKLSAYAMAALVLVHVAAALKHQFFDRDGLMLRMLPGRR